MPVVGFLKNISFTLNSEYHLIRNKPAAGGRKNGYSVVFVLKSLTKLKFENIFIILEKILNQQGIFSRCPGDQFSRCLSMQEMLEI